MSDEQVRTVIAFDGTRPFWAKVTIGGVLTAVATISAATFGYAQLRNADATFAAKDAEHDARFALVESSLRQIVTDNTDASRKLSDTLASLREAVAEMRGRMPPLSTPNR